MRGEEGVGARGEGERGEEAEAEAERGMKGGREEAMAQEGLMGNWDLKGCFVSVSERAAREQKHSR